MSTRLANAADSPDIQRTRWRIDPLRSSVEFHVRNFYGLQTVKGRFERYNGTLDLAAKLSIELTIDAGSLNTNNARRDEHLRSADFFASANHPRIRFISELATMDGERLRVRGELHAAGNSTPLELDGVIRPDGDELDVGVTTFARSPQSRHEVEPAGNYAEPKQAHRSGSARQGRLVAGFEPTPQRNRAIR